MFKNIRWSVVYLTLCIAFFTMFCIVISDPTIPHRVPGIVPVIFVGVAFWCGLRGISWINAETALRSMVLSTPFSFSVKERWKWYRVIEPEMEKYLESLAMQLHRVINRENEVMDGRDLLEGTSQLQQLHDCAREVRRLKKKFWDSHKTFRRFGFKLKTSYKDYIY